MSGIAKSVSTVSSLVSLHYKKEYGITRKIFLGLLKVLSLANTIASSIFDAKAGKISGDREDAGLDNDDFFWGFGDGNMSTEENVSKWLKFS